MLVRVCRNVQVQSFRNSAAVIYRNKVTAMLGHYPMFRYRAAAISRNRAAVISRNKVTAMLGYYPTSRYRAAALSRNRAAVIFRNKVTAMLGYYPMSLYRAAAMSRNREAVISIGTKLQPCLVITQCSGTEMQPCPGTGRQSSLGTKLQLC